MDFYDVVERRRSIRSFAPTPVPDDVVARALKAAQRSPSPLNSQPWRFIVLNGQARDTICSIVAGSSRLLEDLLPLVDPAVIEQAVRFFSDLGGAPTVIVVTLPRFTADYDRKVALLAVGGAVNVLQHALAAEGVGSVCVTSAVWVEERIRTDLGLENDEFATVIPIGYPAAPPATPVEREDKVLRLDVWPRAAES